METSSPEKEAPDKPTTEMANGKTPFVTKMLFSLGLLALLLLVAILGLMILGQAKEEDRFSAYLEGKSVALINKGAAVEKTSAKQVISPKETKAFGLFNDLPVQGKSNIFVCNLNTKLFFIN